jgi:hypothetical protein
MYKLRLSGFAVAGHEKLLAKKAVPFCFKINLNCVSYNGLALLKTLLHRGF